MDALAGSRSSADSGGRTLGAAESHWPGEGARRGPGQLQSPLRCGCRRRTSRARIGAFDRDGLSPRCQAHCRLGRRLAAENRCRRGSIELLTAPSARAAVDRLDDLGAVDALQEVDVSPRLVCPLALDDDQRDALASHLNRVRVAELVSGESASHAGPRGCLT